MAAGKCGTQHAVLVVEDDPEINRLIGAYVEFAGYHCVSALDGGNALSHSRDHHPCVIVLDLMLPDISGWEVCRQLKNDPGTCDIPIIILTALDNEDSRQEGMRCGVVAYLTKPFNPDELLAVLNKYAGSKEPQASK